jgi:hypothetical protein
MRTNKTKWILSVSAAVLMAAPAIAATESVTQKSSTVNPDGSVSYESHTIVQEKAAVPPVVSSGTTTTTVVTTDAPAVPVGTTTTTVVTRPVTFYYYDTSHHNIVANAELTEPVFKIWDTDGNDSIDNHEYYNNAMVMYEPVEYNKRTYQDIDMDGLPELTKEEYTIRLQKLPGYPTLNTDKKDGISVYEFTGFGFQAADLDDNNQVSYDELRKAFYGQARLASEPTLYNDPH